MTFRDTGTGGVLEQMVLPALERGNYRCRQQVQIGSRPGGGRHIVDVVAEDAAGRACLVSVKWQQVSGTAEQKVPFEVICLSEAILAGQGAYEKAYLVLGGEGWKLRDYYINGGLERHLKHGHLVTILSFESFIARANRGALL